MSQNRDPQDRLGVMAALRTSDADREMLALMARFA